MLQQWSNTSSCRTLKRDWYHNPSMAGIPWSRNSKGKLERCTSHPREEHETDILTGTGTLTAKESKRAHRGKLLAIWTAVHRWKGQNCKQQRLSWTPEFRGSGSVQRVLCRYHISDHLKGLSSMDVNTVLTMTIRC